MRSPVEVIVVVPVPPKYAVYAERRVEEALVNCCSAVQEFALPRLREMVEADPPTSAPSVPVTVRVVLAVAKDDVATVCSCPVPPTVYVTPFDVRFERLVMF